MTDHWVINASPLILLGKAEQLQWVSKLGGVVIPQSVADEIGAGSVDDPASTWIAGDGTLHIQPDELVIDPLKAWDFGGR